MIVSNGRVWIVETFDEELGQWAPTNLVEFSREDARKLAREATREWDGDRFRVKRYSRIESKRK